VKIAIDLDRVLGDTRPLWRAWLADASRRYRSIAPLDTERLPDDRAEAAKELDQWARAGIGDWRAALERFAEEHGPIHLRPDSEAAAALRRLRARGARLGVFTDAPEPLARVALAQLGAARRLDEVEAGAGALERLLGRLGRGAIIVRSQRELADLSL
jgi:phosphoglycolate phosphatase-like HAD superfamily hydrolase